MATSTATGTVGEAEAEAEAEAGEDGGGSGWRLPVLPALRMREDLREGASLVALMGMSYDDWDAFTRGSAVRRAGYGGFRRNVAVAIGNWLAGEHDPGEAVGVLRDALADEEAVVRAHAAWALGRVGSASARAALSARASVERDVAVLEELSAALGA